MSTIWRVERNTGSRAYLIFMRMRKVVWRPQTMSREDFFAVLAPGVSIEDSIAESIFGAFSKDNELFGV
jgi:hypothetical protein